MRECIGYCTGVRELEAIPPARTESKSYGGSMRVALWLAVRAARNQVGAIRLPSPPTYGATPWPYGGGGEWVRAAGRSITG